MAETRKFTNQQVSELYQLCLQRYSYDPLTGMLTHNIVSPRNTSTKRGDRVGWFNKSNNYWCTNLNGASFRVHQLIWLIQTGTFPHQIDHINGDKCDNRFHNLRDVTTWINNRNTKKQVNNTSGVTGVVVTKHNTYRAHIRDFDGHYVYLGTYKTLQQAADSRKQGEIKYGYHENHGREM